MKKKLRELFFDRVAYEIPSIHAVDGVSVSTAFVYHEESRGLLYVMEKIGKIWHYTKWSDIEKTECGTSSRKMQKIIENDWENWLNKQYSFRSEFDGGTSFEHYPYFRADDRIEWQGSPRRSNAYQFIYGRNPLNVYSNLRYINELKNKRWSFARWPGPKYAIGTMKQCRDAIRQDYLQIELPENNTVKNTVTANYSSEVSGVLIRPIEARKCSVGQKIKLIRDPYNLHDPNAIKVYADSHIGFVPRELAKRIAPLLDSGANYTAKITYVRKHFGDVSSITICIEIERKKYG